MDFVDPILSAAKEIYSLVERVKANKKRCQRVSCRVKALEKLVRFIQQGDAVNTHGEVETALKELSITLQSAKELIEKYTSANFVERILKSSSHGDEFSTVNERLTDAFDILRGTQQEKQGQMLYKVFELATRKKEDEVDGMEDNKELQRLLLEHVEDQKKKIELLQVNVEKIVEILTRPKVASVDIRMIKPKELEYDSPKELLMKTSTSEVYKGKYQGFTVAIKRYIGPVNATPSQVKSVFDKEVVTMKRFESPNILRMFGICVKDENGPNPEFLIVMEYCKKGSLRHVLDNSDCKLPWIKKARMCRDAAQGLYRLHQTEEKSNVHGCITSCKFLVAEGYTVKLGGFELSKTETSLKRQSKYKETRSLCYSSPQALNNINHVYSKECEMYSFGIVLWEIATRKKPFDGYSDEAIHQKVYEERYQEPLPDDCPEPLGQLIKDCRAYDGFKRPSAGVLVDKLCSVVAKMEMKKETQL